MESVYIPIPVDEVTEEEPKPSKTYKLDLDAGRIVGYVDELEAVNQAILKAIITPRFKSLIYFNNQYGSEVADAIIAKDASPDYTTTVIPGFIKDALSTDERILDVYDFEIELKGDSAYISFKADTVFGETEMEVEI